MHVNQSKAGYIRAGLAIVSGVLLSLAAHPSEALRGGTLIVHVDGGRIRGDQKQGVDRYLGVPYAAAPVGELRWRAPTAVKPWRGVRSATEFGASCMQDQQHSRLPWTEEFMTQGPISEDCLFLNVWSPGQHASNRPVMVYIYGGGFSEGSGSVAVYEGAALAQLGVVVVTINYRLGPLGFLAHPQLTSESPDHVSGNYALLDQIAALQWVQRNVGTFGGDKHRVTIFGQSAGAMSVAALIQSPQAHNLFTRAIEESGPGLVPNERFLRTLRDAEADGIEFAQTLGAADLNALRALPASKVATWPVTGQARRPRGFVRDEHLVSATDQVHGVALMVGLVAGDGRLFTTGAPVNLQDYRQMARQNFKDSADEFLHLYPAAQDADVPSAYSQYVADRLRLSLHAWTAEQSQALGPIYTYYFDRAIPWPEHPEFGAFHTAEVPYVFRTLDRLPRPWAQDDRTLSDRMSHYWVNFAATGNPNAAGLPEWPAYSVSERRTMHLGVQCGPMPEAPAEAAKLLQDGAATAK
jgi:para-nitrobenzyl esterase